MASYNLVTINDDPDGIIKISKNHGINVLFKIPVYKVNNELNKIPELSHSGIYTLYNSRQIHSDNRLYVGQVNSKEHGCAFKNRMEQHKLNDWWDTAIFMTSFLRYSINSTENNYLENRFVNIIAENKRFLLENKNIPFGGNLDSDLKNSLNAWIDENKIILKLINLNFLDKCENNQFGYARDDFEDIVEDITNCGIDVDNEITDNSELILHLKINSRNVDATCLKTNHSYKILKGSRVSNILSPSLDQSIVNIRNELATIVNDDYVLTQNIDFKSPSTAAKFVVGYSINGWVAWKNPDGITLHELIRIPKIDNQ